MEVAIPMKRLVSIVRKLFVFLVLHVETAFTPTQAYQAMKDVQKILDNGGRLVYSPKGSAGINKNEYVKIEMT